MLLIIYNYLRVKLRPSIIIIFQDVKTKEQGQQFITQEKKTTLVSLLYYNY
jgi:hypothetical protein